KSVSQSASASSFSAFVFYGSAARRVLHSFPTRRSSDLIGELRHELATHAREQDVGRLDVAMDDAVLVRLRGGAADPLEDAERLRSEEHTSELQSRSDLVCRLLLEKKKTN